MLFLAICIALGMMPLRRPSVVPANAPADLFSAERALPHLQVIAQHPRPVASPAHAAVREYLVQRLTALDLDVRVQSGEVRRGSRSFPVHNIMGHLPGTSGHSSVMLCAHYDSVAASPGACDNGSAVAAILETLRALREGPPLTNDLIILFTDAEENGMLGARHFVRDDPLAKDNPLVLNFEARGTGGPVHMFQTSPSNDALIREFLEAAPFPLANSLSAAIYHQMPNATDLTVFMDAAMAGLDFAYIGEPWNYHTPGDNVANLDLTSMQHQGSYMLALARHFGQVPYSPTPSSSAVYFNALGHWVVSYPAWLVWPLTLLATLGVLLSITIAIRARRMTSRGVMAGVIALPLAIASGVVAGWILRQLLMWFLDLSAVPGNPVLRYCHLITASMLLLACIAFVLTYRPFIRRWNIRDLMAGAAVHWLAGLIGLSYAIPGGTFLLLIPLLAWTVACILELTLARQSPRLAGLVALLPPAVTLILFTPVVLPLYVAIPAMLAPLTVAASLFPLSFCLQQFGMTTAAELPRGRS